MINVIYTSMGPSPLLLERDPSNQAYDLDSVEVVICRTFVNTVPNPLLFEQLLIWAPTNELSTTSDLEKLISILQCKQNTTH